jgi:xanthine dehydrogenase accessory factor
MTPTQISHGPIEDPISALAAASGRGVLGIITRVEGPSYRPLGARMAILADGRRVGTLSSGCIEADLALHAQSTLETGKPVRVVYGRGSPFIDIQLPCGGGLEILLIPNPDKAVLDDLNRKQTERAACTLVIEGDAARLSLAETGETGGDGSRFQVRIAPEVFFYVFGKGPEASTFATLVQSAGYPNLLLSPDKETLEYGENAGCPTRHLKRAEFPATIKPDRWSAVILFFHDHEWEPPILAAAVDTPAFYIGAQGSQRARDARLLEISALTGPDKDLSRLKGPIGLIPSVRDARTLAVSVLAEVLLDAKQGNDAG